MKSKVCFLLIVLFGVCTSLSLFAKEDVHIKGTWGGGIVRSLTPAPPKAFIDGNALSITSESPLLNLQATVYDETGSIVYQEIISLGSPNFTETIILPDLSGTYLLKLSHAYGLLTGFFEIK